MLFVLRVAATFIQIHPLPHPRYRLVLVLVYREGRGGSADSEHGGATGH